MKPAPAAIEPQWVQGGSLVPGDVIYVWWAPNRATIVRIEPYKGPLGHLWPKGARILHFAETRVGQTMPNDAWETVYNRKPAEESA